jgi:hypothetical protein
LGGRTLPLPSVPSREEEWQTAATDMAEAAGGVVIHFAALKNISIKTGSAAG